MITGDDFNPRAGRGRGGLRGACCSDCAGGLGDASGGGLMGSAPNWLLIASLTIGAIAGSLAIYDHLKKKRRRRRRRPTNIEGRSTQQIPVQSMHDLVYGGRRAA